jgi:hypothetical protein
MCSCTRSILGLQPCAHNSAANAVAFLPEECTSMLLMFSAGHQVLRLNFELQQLSQPSRLGALSKESSSTKGINDLLMTVKLLRACQKFKSWLGFIPTPLGPGVHDVFMFFMVQLQLGSCNKQSALTQNMRAYRGMEPRGRAKAKSQIPIITDMLGYARQTDTYSNILSLVYATSICVFIMRNASFWCHSW